MDGWDYEQARFPGIGLIPSIKSTLFHKARPFLFSILIKASFIRGNGLLGLRASSFSLKWTHSKHKVHLVSQGSAFFVFHSHQSKLYSWKWVVGITSKLVFPEMDSFQA